GSSAWACRRLRKPVRSPTGWPSCVETRKLSTADCASSCRAASARSPCSMTLRKRRSSESWKKCALEGWTAPMSQALSAELRDLLALHLVPGLGPRLTSALLERLGSAAAVLKASATQLQEVPHIGGRIADGRRLAMERVDVDAELALMERSWGQLFGGGRNG